VLVTDILVHELGSHVDVPLPVLVPHVHALGLGDNQRIQGRLNTPGVDHVFLIIPFDVALTHAISPLSNIEKTSISLQTK
jgi:hypothetical protein